MSDYRMTVAFKSPLNRDELESWVSSSIKTTTGGFVNHSRKEGGVFVVIAYIPEMPAALWRSDPEEFTRILAGGWERYLEASDVVVRVEDR